MRRFFAQMPRSMHEVDTFLLFLFCTTSTTGKTHIAKRICRFLSFFHDIPSQIFNVGDYRRQLFGDFLPADFYDPENEEGLVARHTACDAALADLIAYMRQDGVRVAAFDATNSTRDRREHVIQKLTESGLGVKRMFVESICNDDGVSRFVCVCALSLSAFRHFQYGSEQ